MIRNYFKVALRNLWKNKVFTFINIFGLTIGMASFLLIALYVFDELTFDAFHKNSSRIYRVVEHKTSAEGKEIKNAGVPYQVSVRAKSDLPAVANSARITSFGRANISAADNPNVFYDDFQVADEGFLKIFDFRLLRGDRNTALNTPHTAVVTEETATKLFGTTDVLGRAVKVDRDTLPFKITGVLKNFPANSHLSFNVCFSEASMNTKDFRDFVSSDWNSNAFTSYLLLDGNAAKNKVEDQITQLVASNNKNVNKEKRNYILQPLTGIHFYSGDIEGNIGKTGSITYIYVFAVIALFVLLIACINYMNLATARFTNRAKEIAVRKVTGASKKNLVEQFLSESFLVTVIALVFALSIVEILLPKFNAFTEKQLALNFNTDYRIWSGIALVALIAGLLSGLYPAMFQARLNPLQLFKNKINTGKGNLTMRSSLVVFQFSLSIIMIVSTLIVYLQMRYVNTKDMGFNKDHLVVVDINSGKVRRQAQTIKDEFAKLPQVTDVSVSSRVPGEWKNLVKVKVKSDKTQGAEGADMFFVGVDEKFINTYGITLYKGRNFAATGSVDSASVIINEMAAKELGITQPAEQQITIPLEDGAFRARVVGIVKDFNFQSLRQPLAPMVLGYQQNPIQSIDYFTARIGAASMVQTLTQMEAVIHNIDQNHLFEYHFLDKQWELFYREDRIRKTIFLIVAMLTIVIACMGLFGLATYAAEQRIKEIGIRKVLGASISGIVAMLSGDFIKLVLLAILIAVPVSWWAMSKWLNDFAYRINISWWMFAVAGLLAIFIALFTISFQAIKAALANPVKSLRTE